MLWMYSIIATWWWCYFLNFQPNFPFWAVDECRRIYGIFRFWVGWKFEVVKQYCYAEFHLKHAESFTHTETRAWRVKWYFNICNLMIIFSCHLLQMEETRTDVVSIFHWERTDQDWNALVLKIFWVVIKHKEHSTQIILAFWASSMYQ